MDLCPNLTSSQSLLLHRLTALHPEKACRDICTVYADTKRNSLKGLSFWFTGEFDTALKEFVKWFNMQNPTINVTENQARQVLDLAFTG
jgi:hypothetical protein